MYLEYFSQFYFSKTSLHQSGIRAFRFSNFIKFQNPIYVHAEIEGICFIIDCWIFSFYFLFSCFYSLENTLQVLRLHLDFPESIQQREAPIDATLDQKYGSLPIYSGALAAAMVLTSIGVLIYLKRSKMWS